MNFYAEAEKWVEEETEEINKYLQDPNKGIELISKLLSYDKKYNNKLKQLKRLDDLLDWKLLETSGKINLSNEIELYEKLTILSDKMYEQNKIQLLKNKSVVGIGGKFSAGKSKFINALLNSDILPEDQTPTTSIATYIIRESVQDIRAYTYNDQDIPLDMEAAQALTHEFYEKYNLGFSQFIHNLVINVPDFRYSNIALLDTPGYNKSDSGIKKTLSDAEKAYTQLKTIDFLIWLIDIENGCIGEDDIKFIQALNTKNPVLIVLNKADKKTPSAIKSILQKSKNSLENTGINVYDVIAYSAFDKKEYFGTNKLNSFMNNADRDKNCKENIEKQIDDIINTISRELKAKSKKTIEQRNKIGDIIFHSEDIMEIQALVELYSDVFKSVKVIAECEKDFDRTKNDIRRLLKSIEGNNRKL